MAAEGGATLLTKDDYKAELKKRGLPVSGNKAALLKRLQGAGWTQSLPHFQGLVDPDAPPAATVAPTITPAPVAPSIAPPAPVAPTIAPRPPTQVRPRAPAPYLERRPAHSHTISHSTRARAAAAAA